MQMLQTRHFNPCSPHYSCGQLHHFPLIWVHVILETSLTSVTSGSTPIMAEASRNPLISTKPSDSGLHVALHPLVLLTISDHITRHAARQQQEPIVGALLGQQQGREISLEHAFECLTMKGPHDEVLLHHTWFNERVQQCMISYCLDI
jgi:hypothetical protein